MFTYIKNDMSINIDRFRKLIFLNSDQIEEEQLKQEYEEDRLLTIRENWRIILLILTIKYMCILIIFVLDFQPTFKI